MQRPSRSILRSTFNSSNPALTAMSVWGLASQAEMLDLLELGAEAIVVTHVGGAHGDRQESAARWARAWETLPEPVRRRLVLKHDDLRFSAADTLWIHARTGVPLVFDHPRPRSWLETRPARAAASGRRTVVPPCASW